MDQNTFFSDSADKDQNTPKLKFLYSLNNPVFCCYLFWTAILVIKMLLMSIVTAIQRFRTKTFPNEEDLFFKNIGVTFNNPQVERARRAHRNDLESILPFFIIALAFISLDVSEVFSMNLIRIASVCRLIHTLVYAFRPVPQPTRAIFYYIAWLITIFMASVIIARTATYI